MPSIAMEGKLNVTTKPLHYAVFLYGEKELYLLFMN